MIVVRRACCEEERQKVLAAARCDSAAPGAGGEGSARLAQQAARALQHPLAGVNDSVVHACLCIYSMCLQGSGDGSALAPSPERGYCKPLLPQQRDLQRAQLGWLEQVFIIT